MSVPWAVGLCLCLTANVAPLRLFAQTMTAAPVGRDTLPPARHPFDRPKKVLATYDNVADSTHLVTVGGITQRFKPDKMEALRDLLDRAGARPLSEPSSGGT
jgi:hypothetical protein